MATYRYICDKCEHEFETMQKMTDDKLTDCPEPEEGGCGEKDTLRRAFGAGSFILKGGGYCGKVGKR